SPGLVAVSFSKEVPFTGVKTISNPVLVIGLVSESRISVLTVTGSTVTTFEQVLVPRLALLTVTDTVAMVVTGTDGGSQVMDEASSPGMALPIDLPLAPVTDQVITESAGGAAISP